MKIHIGPPRKNRSVKIHIDDYDVWNMDNTLAKIIVPMLKKLKENSHGYPAEFMDPEIGKDGINYGGNGKGPKGWDEILDKMIEGFELIASEDWPSYSKEDIQKAQHALHLFAHYYMSLWD